MTSKLSTVLNAQICIFLYCAVFLLALVKCGHSLTHWTVTAISLHVTTFVGVCHE